MKSFNTVPIKRLVSLRENRLKSDFQGKQGLFDLRTWFAINNCRNNDNFSCKTVVSSYDVESAFNNTLKADKMVSQASQFSGQRAKRGAYLEYCKSSLSEFVPKWVDFPKVDVDKWEEPKFGVAEPLMKRVPGFLCPIEYKKVRCPGCGEWVSKASKFCGNPVDCPLCARCLAVRQGTAIFQKLNALPGPVVAYPDFTMPADLVSELLRGSGLTNQQFGDILLKVTSRVMKKHFPGMGWVAGYHGWHSRTPLSEPHPHVHFLLPMVRLVNAKYEKVKVRNSIITYRTGKRVVLKPVRYRFKLVSGGLEPVSWWLTGKKLEAIREDYRKELKRVFGLWIPKANFWWQYFYKHQEGKFRHECSYLARRPILDINRYLLKTGQEDLTSEESYWLNYQLESEGRFHRVRWYGILSNSKISEILALLGQNRLDGTSTGVTLEDLKILSELELNSLKEVACWNCGVLIPGELWLVAETFVSGKPPPNLGLKPKGWRQYREVSS